MENETLTLAEATTEQLLIELFNRPTFVGVVVYSPSSHKFSGQSHTGFELLYTCGKENAAAMLAAGVEAAAQAIDADEQESE